MNPQSGNGVKQVSRHVRYPYDTSFHSLPHSAVCKK
jgi:hypothetical protein